MLLLPSVDRLRFADLTRVARTGIARRAPAWTNHNLADPGITLLDLGAALAETTAFELDQFPEPLLRAFLDLAGFPPRAVRCAETTALVAGAATYRVLPTGLGATGPLDEAFTTLEPTYVGPARLVEALAGGRPIGLGPDGPVADPFDPMLMQAPVLDLGFDALPAPPGERFRLAVWTASPGADAALVDALAEAAAQARAIEWCGRRVADLYSLARHYGAEVAWEYLGADGAWRAADVVADETRALTLSGCVLLAGPPDVGADAAGPDPAGRFRFRARVARGAYDTPTPIAGVALGAVRLRHWSPIEGWEPLAAHRGVAVEQRPLADGPAVPESLQLRVTPPGGSPEIWPLVPLLERASPHEKVVGLDAARRSVRFGDGRQGAVAPAGSALAARYARGGGTAGLVPPGSLTILTADADLQVVIGDWPALSAMLTLAQPGPAYYGRDAETVAQARGRLARALATPARMATLADIEGRARAIPGLPVARAFAMADVHPDFEGFAAVGCVTLVIVPRIEARWRSPTSALCSAVRLGLEPARLLTTELHVVGPCYVPVSVEMTVTATNADPGLRERLTAALDAFLEPFTGAGGAGWRPGSALYRAEFEAVAARLSGIACVESVSLRRTDSPPEAAECARLQLCATELPIPGPHTLVIEGDSLCPPRPVCSSEGSPR